MMLKFYSFYKQATQGPCNIPRPGFWDPVGRYKWDAWNSLGDMTKEDAMVAYVDEMKKILESMPMTEKVEELLQVIGPFYEIVEDKKHGRGSGITSELRTALTSTPNCKAVNGKAESSDSGAESEEEDMERQEEEDEDDEVEETEQSEQGENDGTEDVAAMQHLTSDSDSEIFCDSMEQFGQEEVDHTQLLEDAMLTEGSLCVLVGGEVKDGGEDGKASGRTPQKEKSGHDKAEYYSSRRGRTNRMHPVGEGSRGGQIGSGGDGGDRRGSDRGPNGSLNEHIAVVLMRLQEDMQNVLQRLQTLEALTASQKPSWWPFEISSGTLAFAIVWPFVAHWLIHLYLQRRRRKPT
uniref:ACB domain-containing protein n=1 Tax=Pyxicephalus adspersus TaxID=30357 RepID=A0AAV3A2F8_PYXAD|nr:TPA: hypothetical protein GDO54_012706 [Pyxicephalus adspersus]